MTEEMYPVLPRKKASQDSEPVQPQFYPPVGLVQAEPGSTSPELEKWRDYHNAWQPLQSIGGRELTAKGKEAEAGDDNKNGPSAPPLEVIEQLDLIDPLVPLHHGCTQTEPH